MRHIRHWHGILGMMRGEIWEVDGEWVTKPVVMLGISS